MTDIEDILPKVPDNQYFRITGPFGYVRVELMEVRPKGIFGRNKDAVLGTAVLLQSEVARESGITRMAEQAIRNSRTIRIEDYLGIHKKKLGE